MGTQIKILSSSRFVNTPRRKIISQSRIYYFFYLRRLLAKETMINMKFSVAIITLVACLAYSAKIDNGTDREKREESADKDLAGLKNLANFEALKVKMRHARDQLRQDASCDDCRHCPKCKPHCPGSSNCHHCKYCYGPWTACCNFCGHYDHDECKKAMNNSNV